MSQTDEKLINAYISRLTGALIVGLDWDTALIAINVPQDLIPIIEESEEIQQLKKRVEAELELELLELHRTARKIAASKGQGRPIEWMLGQINPSKYAPKNGEGMPRIPTVLKDDI